MVFKDLAKISSNYGDALSSIVGQAQSLNALSSNPIHMIENPLASDNIAAKKASHATRSSRKKHHKSTTPSDLEDSSPRGSFSSFSTFSYSIFSFFSNPKKSSKQKRRAV